MEMEIKALREIQYLDIWVSNITIDRYYQVDIIR